MCSWFVVFLPDPHRQTTTSQHLLIHLAVQASKDFYLYIPPVLWPWGAASSIASGRSLKSGLVIYPLLHQTGSLLAASILSCIFTLPKPQETRWSYSSGKNGYLFLLGSVFMMMKWQGKQQLGQCWNKSHGEWWGSTSDLDCWLRRCGAPTVGCLSSHHFCLDVHFIVKGLARKQQSYMPVKWTQSVMSWLRKMSYCSVVSHPAKAIFVPCEGGRADWGNIYNVAE